MLSFKIAVVLLVSNAFAQLSDANLKVYNGSLSLPHSFNPIKESYWTGLPHHRRTPFAVSPDGKSAYLAYLDASQTGVYVQQVDPSTFASVGTPVTIAGGKEAGGLVAHDDGFALLTNEAMPTGTTNAPPSGTPVAVLYRYTGGTPTWKTWLGGPDMKADMGMMATPDINGDLVYSESSGMYGAYFVVTAYSGNAKGHFGDAIQYVTKAGTLQQIAGASSAWGCSHNTGIAFEAADTTPFASICAEDQGAIWLNTGGTGMDKSGVKISNENTTNGASNEPMGGMSGSYSGLAQFIGSTSYIFTWVSRGAKDLTTNAWMGQGYTNSVNRTVGRNVAITTFKDKKTIDGQQASSVLGSNGDSQVNWITNGTADCQNAHVAAFDGTNALVTWEEIANPTCQFIAMGCKGTFTGVYYQLVTNGKKAGAPLKSTNTFVAGDMVTMSDGKICWPFVAMDWKLDGPVRNPASVTKLSFACMSLSGSNSIASATSIVPVVSSVRLSSTTLNATRVSTTLSQQVTPSSSSAIATGSFVVSPSDVTVESTPTVTETLSLDTPSVAATSSLDIPIVTETKSLDDPSDAPVWLSVQSDRIGRHSRGRNRVRPTGAWL